MSDGMVNAGIVAYTQLPHLVPGVYGIAAPYRTEGGDPEAPIAHSVVVERTTVRVYGNHEIRHSVPISGMDGVLGHRFIRQEGKHTFYHFVSYDGKGTFGVGEARIAINLSRTRERTALVFDRELNLPNEGDRGFTLTFGAPGLSPGFYRVTVGVEDVDSQIWLRRRTDPLMLAGFGGDMEDAKRNAQRWMPMMGRPIATVPQEGTVRPLVEAYLAPHWATVPFTGARRMSFSFENPRNQDLFVVGVYTGEVELKLRGIRIEKRSFETLEDGEWKPLNLRREFE